MDNQKPRRDVRERFLQIRLDESERDQLRQAAKAARLDVSTWARVGLLGLAEASCIQIHLDEEERALLQRAARADFLDMQVWAKRALLRLATDWASGQTESSDDSRRTSDGGGKGP